jgi:hypothetical protein
MRDGTGGETAGGMHMYLQLCFLPGVANTNNAQFNSIQAWSSMWQQDDMDDNGQL